MIAALTISPYPADVLLLVSGLLFFVGIALAMTARKCDS